MTIPLVDTDQRAPLQRYYAVGLMGLQSMLLWKLMSGGPFALIAFLLALAGSLARPERMLPKFDLARWSLVLFVLFLVKSRFMPHEIGSMDGFVYSQYAYEIACGLMAIQVLILWGREYVVRMPVIVLALAGVALVFLGDARVTTVERVLTSVAAGIYCFLAVLFAAGARSVSRDHSAANDPLARRRRLMWIAPVVVGSLLGQMSGVWLFRNEQDLELLIAKLIDSGGRQSTAGFSGHVGLDSSSWRTDQDSTVALQISGTTRPLYLKGQCLNLFRRSNWIVTYGVSPLDPVLYGPLKDYENSGTRAYPIAEDQDRPVTQILDVWPQPAGASTFLFLPHDALGIVTAGGDVSHDPIGNVRRSEADRELHYRVLLTDQPTTYSLTEEEREGYLHVSRRLDPRVKEIAADVLQGCETTRQKIDRIEAYFHDNFQYQLGVEVPYEQDPLGWFLVNRIPAHCEFFATATAVMLRLEGVPTRLATGYVAAEWNPTAQLMIARLKDAHAWVEAFDEDTGQWVTVESTPAAGTPQPRTTQGLEALRQSLWHQFSRLFDAAVKWLQQDYSSLILPGLLSFVLLAALGAMIYFFRNRLRSLFVADPALTLVPAELRRERIRLDRRLARLGLERGRSETPNQFAARIERTLSDDWGHRAAECYRLYSRLRFDSQQLSNPQHLRELSKLRKFL